MALVLYRAMGSWGWLQFEGFAWQLGRLDGAALGYWAFGFILVSWYGRIAHPRLLAAKTWPMASAPPGRFSFPQPFSRCCIWPTLRPRLLQ